MNPRTIACLAILAATAAEAQVYRCGNTYSQTPCPDGAAVAASDPRSPAEARKADAQTLRNRKVAAEMEQARLAEEKKVAGPSMVVTGVRPAASAAAKPASSAQKKKAKGKKEPEHFTAVAPAPKK